MQMQQLFLAITHHRSNYRWVDHAGLQIYPETSESTMITYLHGPICIDLTVLER